MKITRLAAWRLDLPFRDGAYGSSGGSAEGFDSMVVAIETDAGITGWGEMAPLGGFYAPFFAAGARAGVAELAPDLIGQDPTQITRLGDVMDSALKGHPYVKSAIDMACWDILGKQAGMPLAELLGGRFGDSVTLYRAVPRATTEEMVGMARGYADAGYRRIQVKVGGDPDADIEHLYAVADALGHDIVLFADANGGWQTHQARRFLDATRALDYYLEQPCASYAEGSISESYASPRHGGGEAGPVVGAGGEANEVEPAQVVVQIAGGDATARTQEVFQPAVAAVHRLHMQIAPNPFPHRAVECFVAHPERGGARGVARATVGDQQGVLRDHRVEGSRERRRIDPGQHRADRRSAPVCRHENRHLLAREAALLRLAAPPPCLASQPARALPALQDVGLVRFHDPLEHLRIAPRRRQKPVTPAERRAHRHVAARRRGLHRLPLRQRRPERQPAFLVVQARQQRTAQRVEGPAAALALVAPQRPRAIPRETAPSLAQCGQRRASSTPSSIAAFDASPSLRPDSTASASRRCARVSPRAAESHTWKPLMSIIQPPDVPGILSQIHTNRELSHAECLALRPHCARPMVLDESIDGLAALIQAHTDGVADGVTIKIARVGGVTRARQLRDVAVELGIAVTVEDTGGSDIDTAAIAHLSLSTPESLRLHTVDFNNWVTVSNATGMPPCEDGRMAAPTGPGLGVEPRPDVLGEPFHVSG